MILLFMILFALEAMHDAHVINELIYRGGRDTELSKRYNRSWHAISAAISVITIGVLSWLWFNKTGYHWALCAMSGLIVRYYCMTYLLNGIRGLNLFYKGDGMIDGIAKKVGEIPSFVISTLAVIAFIALETLYHV